jgi:heme oxygenase
LPPIFAVEVFYANKIRFRSHDSRQLTETLGMRPTARTSILPAPDAGAKKDRIGSGNALRSEEASQAWSKYRPVESLSLSQRLQVETALLQREIERRLDLPASITSIDKYLTCLASYYRLYRPLEVHLKTFKQWSKLGISLDDRVQSPRLAQDLSALGVAPVLMVDAPADALPNLPTFAHAVGALYVTERSTLGAPFILRHLQNSLGMQLVGATAFFDGHEANTGERWKSFMRSLDAYGSSQVDSKVIQGALAAFQAIGEWVADGTDR